MYNEEVYDDYLTKNEFKETLEWYKSKLERIYFFKYPSPIYTLPKCLQNKVEKLNNKVKTSNILSDIIKNIYVYNKVDNDKI